MDTLTAADFTMSLRKARESVEAMLPGRIFRDMEARIACEMKEKHEREVQDRWASGIPKRQMTRDERDRIALWTGFS